jgi:hypothetical protein
MPTQSMNHLQNLPVSSLVGFTSSNYTFNNHRRSVEGRDFLILSLISGMLRAYDMDWLNLKKESRVI